MRINSNFDQDAHHGATFDGIWYLFTCYIIPDVGRRHGNMMVFAGIAQAQPKKKAYGQYF